MIFWKRRRRKTAEEPVREAKQPAEAEKQGFQTKKIQTGGYTGFNPGTGLSLFARV